MMVKCRLIFLPFLITFFTAISGYTFFRWWFDIELNAVTFDEKAWELFIPAIISISSIALITRKRFRVFRIKGEEPSMLTKMFLVLALAIPMGIAQALVSSASYELVNLRTSDELLAHESEKFFTIDRYRVSRNQFASDTVFRVRGKHNEDLAINLYVAVPIDLEKNIWYGVRYYKTISNKGSDNEKQAAYTTFIDEANEKFKEHDYYDHSHFKLLRDSELYDGFKNAILQTYPLKTNEDFFILYPQKETLADANDELYFIFYISAAIAFLVVAIVSFVLKTDPKALELYQSGQLDNSDFTTQIVRMLTFRAGVPITTLLVLICLAVYVMGVLNGVDFMNASVNELIPYGAVRRDFVLNGEYWRLITAAFAHFGLAHIAMNLFVLGLGGKFIEPLIGSIRFTLLVVVSAVGCTTLSIYVNESTLSAGSSGINYGLIGALVAMLITRRLSKQQGSDALMLIAFIAVSTVISLFMSNVDHAGHFGGFLGGALVGLFCGVREKKEKHINAAL
ncbi:rhomboid family intramembrane serine protease [Enterovibrio sp. ZSDZ35]|uniref:Rhomboid family intramembrane serine protease n=1 Tax=Enterovibrio qingdaonensis TaxID=2899818 RepID=A0ABT5QGC4_9GAMM|nr:rhomboid family intramembrane serine protease [Enterovibrio sp. ZSDZ35]MDD1779748.1 rhomboid family intramembrane serine protease [Enterovibrio sp. ZSDZ35]